MPRPGLQENARSYARFLFAAWQNEDRAAAREVATESAVTSLFSESYAPVKGKNPWRLQRIPAPVGGVTTVTYRHTDGRTLVMKIHRVGA